MVKLSNMQRLSRDAKDLDTLRQSNWRITKLENLTDLTFVCKDGRCFAHSDIFLLCSSPESLMKRLIEHERSNGLEKKRRIVVSLPSYLKSTVLNLVKMVYIRKISLNDKQEVDQVDRLSETLLGKSPRRLVNKPKPTIGSRCDKCRKNYKCNRDHHICYVGSDSIRKEPKKLTPKEIKKRAPLYGSAKSRTDSLASKTNRFCPQCGQIFKSKSEKDKHENVCKVRALSLESQFDTEDNGDV